MSDVSYLQYFWPRIRLGFATVDLFGISYVKIQPKKAFHLHCAGDVFEITSKIENQKLAGSCYIHYFFPGKSVAKYEAIC